MGKLVLFKIESGSFIQGFRVTVQICEDNPDGITHPFTTIQGDLPPCQPITQHYRQWQDNYRSLHRQTRLNCSPNQITHITQDCEVSASVLKKTLSNWYESGFDSFARLRENLLSELHPQDSIRLLVQTDIAELRFLPWHLFFESFLNRYPQAELAIAPVEYIQIKVPKCDRSQIRILAVFGNDEGIDLQPDLDAISNLRSAHIKTLITPSPAVLFNHLYEKPWDILFFAGHSSTNSQTQEGKISLNDNDVITIAQLKGALKKSIAQGLRLAIFNSCDGLGLAQDLANLHLSQIIVMGEMIPDAVAHVFIRQFLQSFAADEPLYLAVRQAREKLQPLEKEYPCATWLPIICQNPASLPLSWQNLQGLQFNPLVNSHSVPIPANLTNLLWDTRIQETDLLMEYNELAKTQAEVVVNYLDLDLSWGEQTSREILEQGGTKISSQLKQRKIKKLGQVLTTGAGSLSCEVIFHSIIYDYQEIELTSLSLIQTVIRRCLNLADSSAYSSIAFPVLLPHNSSSLSIEQVAIVFAQEIVHYLRGDSDTNLEQVKVIIPNHNSVNVTTVDDRYSRFYAQFKKYLKLDADIDHRQQLLTELMEIYQQRQMQSSVEILQLYQRSLTQIQKQWIDEHLQVDSEDLLPAKSDSQEYELSLKNISQNLNGQSGAIAPVNDPPILQTYNELAAQVWQELVNTEDEEEILRLLDKLDLDIDAFAWLHDQYELAIASAIAKKKKVNQMLQSQVQELSKGQEVLNRYLIEKHENQNLPQKYSGQERNLRFREYPKLNVKVKPEDLPGEYRREKINYLADKKAIKEAIKEGIDLKEIAEIDRNLKIKFGFE